MAQSKNTGHGVVLSRVTGGPTAIGQVASITAPAHTREDVDVSDLDGTVMEFIPSEPYDPGEVTIDMLWTSGETNDQLLDTDFEAATIASWKFVIPAPISRTATFDAWIKSLTPATFNGREGVRRTIVFRLNSAITWS